MTMREIYSLLFILVSSFCSTINAQVIIKNGSVTTCGTVFYDSGGSLGDYKANESFVFTICSSDPVRNHVSLGFDLLDIAAGDEMCFYDGNTTAAPLLACASDLLGSQNTIIQATATNPSGCITVSFRSNGSVQRKGWAANIICIPSCQTIRAMVDATIPPIVPSDTGWIDACPNKTRVNFKAHGIYSQNGYAYTQSDSLSKFEWNFNDGTQVAYGTDVTHVFEKSGGYVVRLTVTDTMGCQNINYIKQRVRISTRPTFRLGNIPSQICAGTEIKLKGIAEKIDTSYQVSSEQNIGTFQAGAVRSERLFIPDDPSKEYKTSLYFSDFGPGQTLTNINDFLDVFVEMEHSWARDLEIKLVCPNRQSVVLHKYDVATRNSNRLNIGQPSKFDAILNEFVNDSTQNPPGKGLRYEWTPTATRTWRSYTAPEYNLPAGKYKSDAALTGLIGCPLNGEWSLVVKDQFQYDNGWIFAWGLDFNKNLYPSIETFKPKVVNHGWVNNSYITQSYSVDSMVIRPKNAGIAALTYRITDDMNCTFDTTLNVNVLPPTSPLCMACNLDTLFNPLVDTTLCLGKSVQLNKTPKGSIKSSITFEAFPNAEMDAVTASLVTPYVSSINISDVYPTTVANPLVQIDSVCITMGTFVPDDMIFTLRAPSGEIVPLFNRRGGLGFNKLDNLCFSPTATKDIATATAPFTGTHQPEGGSASWNNLTGATLTGKWDLLVSDAQGVNKDTLKRWSITFKNQNGLKYSWAPATGLSCTDCPNPIATPSVTTTYSVLVTDSLNCVYNDDIEVVIQDSLAAPILSVSNVNFTFIIFGWDAVPGATDYEISINGGTWQTANGALSHTVSNLKVGDIVNFRVRAINSSSCGSKISSLTQATKPCVATIGNGINRRLEIDSIPCFGQYSPRINFTFANGVAPFTFIIDSLNLGSSPIFIDNISAGTHTAIFIDSTGCSDTLSFTLTQPTPVSLDLTKVDVKCYGDENGNVTVNPQGGVGNYIYRINSFILGEWRNTPVFDTLTAGNYTVEMMDDNGCSASADIELTSPPLLSVNLQKQDIRCFGETSGIATSIVSGGVQPYNWNWSNGGTTEEITNLPVGDFYLTLTDANGCSFSDFLTIEENTEVITTVLVDSVKCFNDETGRIQVSAVGGLDGYTFQWSNGTVGELNEALRAGVYTVTTTDALGCMDTLTTEVFQPTAIVFDSVVTVNTQCMNDATGSATAYTSGGVLPYEYLWTPSNQVAQKIVDVTAGRYVVTVRDANGCILDYETEIQSNSEITADFTIISPIKCNGDTDGSIQVNAAGGAGNFTYLWNTSPAQTSETITNIGAGTYSVTISDQNNCQIVAETILNEPTPLIATIDLYSDVKCKGESNGTATPSVSGGTTFTNGLKYSYRWNDINNQITPVATGLAIGTYTLTVTDANGCTNTADVVISEPLSALTAVAIQTKLGCFNQNTGEAIVEGSGGTGNYTYLWSNLQRTQSVANLGKQSYTVTVTDINGCQAWDTLNVNTYDSIRVVISSIAPTCYGNKNGSIKVDSIIGGAANGNLNNATYRWNTTPIQTNFQAVNISGNRVYTLTLRDNEGCENEFTHEVKEPNPIFLTTITKNVSCFGGNNGEAEVQPIGQKPPFTYQWSTNANSQITSAATSLIAGRYSVTVTDSSNCSVDTSITIAQPTLLKIANQQIVPTKCTGDAVGKISVSIEGGVPQYTYQWSNGGNLPTISNLRSGSYDLIVTDANGCTIQQSFSVAAPNALDGEVAVENVKCFGEANGKITIDAFGGTQPYLFSIDGKTYNGINQVVGVKSGKYDVYIKDANNCTWFESVQITQPPRFTIEAMPNVNLNLGDSIQLFANALNNRGSVNITWKAPYDNTLSCIQCTNPTAKPLFTITYGINAIDSAGCRAADSVTINVIKPRFVLVPTAFTPNNDQVNDRLLVRGKSGTRILVFRVYDRWGELLYEAKNFDINNENAGWDGNFRAQPMTSGLYVWYIEAQYQDGATEILKGSSTLIR